MMKHHYFILSFLLCGLLMFTGCAGRAIHPPDSNSVSAAPIPAAYRIGPGDELEIQYYIDPGFSVENYVIDTEDTLRIDFYYYPVLSKTLKVRPDGYITLPKIGEFKAVGRKPSELAAKISEMYKPHLLYPEATVELIDFNVKVEKLKTAVTTTARGQSKQVLVGTDGKISLPYVGVVSAAGLTSEELGRMLQDSYRKFINNIGISASVLQAHSNRVYVMGQVREPNFYELSMPLTLTQMIATAGGFTKEANTRQVLIIRRGKDGKPEPLPVDAEEIISRGNAAADPLICQHDVIFVPRTPLAEAALTGEFLWRLIPLDFTLDYSLSN